MVHKPLISTMHDTFIYPIPPPRSHDTSGRISGECCRNGQSSRLFQHSQSCLVTIPTQVNVSTHGLGKPAQITSQSHDPKIISLLLSSLSGWLGRQEDSAPSWEYGAKRDLPRTRRSYFGARYQEYHIRKWCSFQDFGFFCIS